MAATLPIINYSATDANGNALDGVYVAVLSGTLSTVDTDDIPGTPLATLYADPEGTTPVANPTSTDGLGNISVCPSAAGYFVLQVYGPSINGQQLFQVKV